MRKFVFHTHPYTQPPAHTYTHTHAKHYIIQTTKWKIDNINTLEIIVCSIITTIVIVKVIVVVIQTAIRAKAA